jgi:N-acetylglucosamine kinase-like BadF-type ATPase
MAYFLGVDGGGTRTTAWLADERERVLARATTGPSNPLKVGFAACQQEILLAARQAVAPVYGRHPKSPAGRGGFENPPLQAVVLGLAGTDRPPIHRKLFAWLRKNIPAHHHLLTSDAAIALRAAIGASPGIIVISGTGSIAFARDDRGRVLRAGGWGTLFDDAGSGYDLGRGAITAALRDYDGRGPRTQLLARVRAALALEDITHVVLQPLTPQEIAALFPVVLEAARRRDYVAARLSAQAGRDLAELALALMRRLGWSRRIVPVVCAGGVFRSSPAIRRSFSSHLRRSAPNAHTLLLRRPPVEGALALARDLSQAAIKSLTPKRHKRGSVKKTLPRARLQG